jgi:peptidoglycan/LPS O-acetylase OafA/YrhL
MGNLSSRSFGIYIVHSPVMEVVARGLYHLAPFVLGYQFIFQPLLLLFGLGVPLMLMLLVERSPLRGYYRYLFG